MSKNKAIEKKIIIALIILAVLQMVNLIVFQVLLRNGYIAVKLIETNRYDSAIKIIRKYNISDNPALYTQIEKSMQQTLTDYIDEKISYEDAYSMIHRYDRLTNLNYDFSNSETLRLFSEIHVSRENMERADDLCNQSEVKASDLAKAINYYNVMIPEDTKHYPELSEKKDSTMKILNEHIDFVYSSGDISDVFIEIEKFMDLCEDGSCSQQCSELRENYVLRSKTELDDFVSSQESKQAYKPIVDEIEQYQKYYSSDKEYCDELTKLKGEYIIKYIDYNISNSTYSKDEVFEVAEKYVSEYPDLDLIDHTCNSFKERITDLIENEDYKIAANTLTYNEKKAKEYKSKLGFSYKRKLLSIYKKWYSSKINAHEYLNADDGYSAIYLAEKANDLSKGSIDENKIIAKAKEYEEDQFLLKINERRRENGIVTLERYSLIDDISNELALRLKNGEEEFDDFWDVANRHNISSLYTTVHSTVTVTQTHSASRVWWEDVETAEYFLENCTGDTAELLFESAQYSKIGIGTAYDESKKSFCWFICLFT